MQKSFLYVLFSLSILIPSEDRWSTTRFEHWWNSKFNTMKFREPFSFIPYKIKIGNFYFGGKDFWESAISNNNTDLGLTPFITNNGQDFDYLTDSRARRGIKLEVDFLSYNFFKNLQNAVDIQLGLGYKLNMPLEKAPVNNWFSDLTLQYYYYPIIHNLNLNINFLIQKSEKFVPYFYYSTGIIESSLFRNSDGDNIIDASGTSKSYGLGFNILKKLSKKSYNLLYGFELRFNEMKFYEIESELSHITQINTQEVGISFTIGIAYGGNRTIGDEGFNELINSNYINAINNFKSFKNKYPKHPKIKKANEMIEFSILQIAYDMFYRGLENEQGHNIDEALYWYDKALIETKDEDLIYEIKSRKYLIANNLFSKLDSTIQDLTIDESILYIEYIEGISSKIKDVLQVKKANLLYSKADMHLANFQYKVAYEIYNENFKIFPSLPFMYKGKINGLIQLLVDKANNELVNNDYISAYQTMQFISKVYRDINDYIDDNISFLKNELEEKKSLRIKNLTQDIISKAKDIFTALDENTVLIVGDSFTKIRKILGEPFDSANRMFNNLSYNMHIYKFNNKTFRLYFENDVLFDIEEIR